MGAAPDHYFRTKTQAGVPVPLENEWHALRMLIVRLRGCSLGGPGELRGGTDGYSY